MNREIFDSERLRSYVGPVLLLLIVLPFAAYAFPPMVGASNSYTVVSNSMAPELHAGDVVFVYDTPPEQITVGDTITYRSPTTDQVTTHKVVEVVERAGERQFQTKGTANEEPDPYVVPPSDVIGVVGFHVPYFGVLLSWIGTDIGIVLFILVPSVLLIGSELWSLAQAMGDQSTNADDTAEANEDSFEIDFVSAKKTNGGTASDQSGNKDQ